MSVLLTHSWNRCTLYIVKRKREFSCKKKIISREERSSPSGRAFFLLWRKGKGDFRTKSHELFSSQEENAMQRLHEYHKTERKYKNGAEVWLPEYLCKICISLGAMEKENKVRKN